MSEKGGSRPPGRLRRWLRRLGRALLLLLLVVVAVLAGVYVYWRHIGAVRLAAAVDAANRQDANWRWDDLEAARPDVPDRENGALQVDKVAELVSPPWPAKESRLPAILQLDPPVRLGANEAAELRKELNEVGPALAEAHALSRFRTGRFPAQGAPESFATTGDHLEKVKSAGNLLRYESILLAHDGKVSEALVSARTNLSAGRALGDEPGSFALLVRLASQWQAVRGAERALAQGEASDAVLADTAKSLREEDAADVLTAGLRGDRAQFYEVSGCLEAGDLSRLEGGKGAFEGDAGTTRLGRVELRAKVPWFRENRARTLDWMTRTVEIAALPAEEQWAAFTRLDQEIKVACYTNYFDRARWLLTLDALMPCRYKAKAAIRSHADLRCAAAALAAERYRLAKGRWPDSLDALVPAYLPAVPKDPFTGEALRLRRPDDGLVIYSVGEDGKDHGGELQHLRKGLFVYTDYGFRLWDVASRRQPAPKPDEEP